jgi:Zn-dependent M28 family amino/carboxypeptidase
VTLVLDQPDRQIVSDLYLSRAGLDFVEELVERFGSRFGGTAQEHQAAAFIRERLAQLGANRADLETFTCGGWTRKEIRLTMLEPVSREVPCIALPYCPPGQVEGPLVYLGDGDPQSYVARRDEIRNAIVMVTTATPKFFHRPMHRCEKLGRAVDAGAIGFIWMRGEAGGLPETGSARFGHACEVPAVSVSYEAGQEMVRLSRRGAPRLQIASTNENHPVTSHNVVAEFRGRERPDEAIVLGGHYDGHDISQAAMDNATGVAVVLEAARALAPHKDLLRRSVRFVAFAQEEMGLHGAHDYAKRHQAEPIRFMLNLDGAGRSINASFQLQGWPEAIAWFKRLFEQMQDTDVAAGDQIGLYSDMYPFAALGIPAATLQSQSVGATPAATRGYGHTPMDSLDKVTARLIQLEAIRVARATLRLATVDEIPVVRKTPAEIGAQLAAVGLDEVLRYERRPVPGA